jgi:cytochrome b561
MSKPAGYSRLQIVLHWAIAMLIGFQVVAHDGMEEAWRALQRGQEYSGIGAQLHVIAGGSVLILALLRLFVRWRRGAPALPAGGKPLLDMAAKLTHWALYALMLVIPASGMAAWFLGIKTAAEAHELFFNALFVLVALHTVAALYHQFVVKDGLIARMMKSR